MDGRFSLPPNGESAVVEFELEGETDERLRVEVYHPDAVEDVAAKVVEGTVPDRGLDEIAVGVEKHRKELQRMLDGAQRGSGDVKFLRGGCGCGKTFMATLAVQDAQDAKFVTSSVVVSDNDLHFQKFDELYRKVVGALSTPACPQGALGDILDRWIGSLEEGLIELGVSEDDPDFDKKVLAKLDEQLAGLTQGRAPVDMTRAVHAIFATAA